MDKSKYTALSLVSGLWIRASSVSLLGFPAYAGRAAERRPSSFPAPLSDDDFPAVHDVQAFPESFGWRGVCANLHSKAVEDVMAFVVVSCDVADTCVWNI